MNKNEYEYVLLTDDNISWILTDQLRQLENMHYQHCLFVPSKLENNTQYVEWSTVKLGIEKNIKSVMQRANQVGLTKEALKERLMTSKNITKQD